MRCIIKVFIFAGLFAFLSSACMVGAAAIPQEETLMGAVVKKGSRFVIEADEGDYIVKGKDPSPFLDKLVVVSGIITESPKGDVLEIRTIVDLADAGD